MESLNTRQRQLLESKHVNWFMRDKYLPLYWRVKSLERKKFMKLDKNDKLIEIYSLCSGTVDELKRSGVNENDEFYKLCVKDLEWITELISRI